MLALRTVNAAHRALARLLIVALALDAASQLHRDAEAELLAQGGEYAAVAHSAPPAALIAAMILAPLAAARPR